MKISKKIIPITLAAVLLCLVPLFRATAVDSTVTNDQINQIKANCLSTKSTLNQLHVSDALLRVNMGQMYESLETKLMVGFDSRVENNKIDASTLKSITEKYDTALDGFRADYITYENQLSATLEIDCVEQPAEFYDSVSKARDDRTKVHNDVVVLNGLVEQYQAALDSFRTAYASRGTN